MPSRIADPTVQRANRVRAHSSAVEHLPYKQAVTGSIPVAPTVCVHQGACAFAGWAAPSSQGPPQRAASRRRGGFAAARLHQGVGGPTWISSQSVAMVFSLVAP
jgi:hypothetical protein